MTISMGGLGTVNLIHFNRLNTITNCVEDSSYTIMTTHHDLDLQTRRFFCLLGHHRSCEFGEI